MSIKITCFNIPRGVNYYTGQSFDLEKITKAEKEVGAMVGFNLAHSIGNVLLDLHKWKGPRLQGWWGYNKDSRFEMPSAFNAIDTSEGWQISNAPILGMAPLIAAMDIHNKAGMSLIRGKGENMSSYMEYLIFHFIPSIKIITLDKRGCQLFLLVPHGKKVFKFILDNGIDYAW